ncbi:Uncharacterised protein [Vibrio cholerae]|nr:Uncharacterised protein [Vibrio cholerae]
MTSTIWPRKISAVRFTSARAKPEALTLTSISSRSMCSHSVTSCTFKTSINLCSCFWICSSCISSVFVVMFSRERVSSSVGDTFSVSMLYPRWEKSPTTRDSAPGWFSNSSEIMCLILGSLRFAQPHFVHPFAFDLHWVNVLSFIDINVDKHQTIFHR